jgi:hypothetical protein
MLVQAACLFHVLRIPALLMVTMQVDDQISAAVRTETVIASTGIVIGRETATVAGLVEVSGMIVQPGNGLSISGISKENW